MEGGLRDGVREVVDGVFGRGVAEFLKAVDEDAAAYPKHREHADEAQGLEEVGHALDDDFAKGLDEALGGLGEVDAKVVGLDDEGDDAVDADGHADADDGEDAELEGGRGIGDRAEGDGHDFCREDKVGADGALDAFALVALGVGGVGGVEEAGELVETFEAKEGSANHEERRDEFWGEVAEGEGAGEEKEEFVFERAEGDALDDGEFAVRGEADYVARGDGGIVNDNAGSFAACFGGLGGGVI